MSYFGRLWRNRRKLDDSSEASRFLFETKKFKPSKKAVHPRAFKDDEVSLSMTTGLDRETVWQLGDRAGKGRKQRALARAVLFVRDARQLACDVRWDEPPWRHGLLQWPRVDLEQRKSLEQQLAQQAGLDVR